jgi:prepilin-type processing-associated H-X9-DG protein|tara:strand:- start:1091 stop:1372 length:282 start_codon:yes stop_codon:yes gene_type:complete
LARASNPYTIGKNIYVNRKVNALFTDGHKQCAENVVNNAWIPEKLFVYCGGSKKAAHNAATSGELCGDERNGGADYDGEHYYASTATALTTLL